MSLPYIFYLSEPWQSVVAHCQAASPEAMSILRFSRFCIVVNGIGGGKSEHFFPIFDFCAVAATPDGGITAESTAA